MKPGEFQSVNISPAECRRDMSMSNTKQTKDEKNLEAVMAKIADMPAPVASRVHEIIMAAVPDLKPRVWYGSAGYAKSASTPVILFYRHDEMFSLGLTEKANLQPASADDGQLMSSAWFFDDLEATTEERIAEIAKQAAG